MKESLREGVEDRPVIHRRCGGCQVAARPWGSLDYLDVSKPCRPTEGANSLDVGHPPVRVVVVELVGLDEPLERQLL
jgi:hypothetical protein